jgi:hypothetical protein
MLKYQISVALAVISFLKETIELILIRPGSEVDEKSNRVHPRFLTDIAFAMKLPAFYGHFDHK